MKSPTQLAALSVLLASSATAQISITSGNLSYSQDFDDLTRSGTAENWVNNTNAPSANNSEQVVGLVGWYANYTGTAQIIGSAGGSSTGRLYSFGSSDSINGVTDRALGSIANDSIGGVSYGVRFVNNTGATITDFTFSFDGEQWRKAANSSAQNNQIVTAYQVFDAGLGSLTAGGWSDNIAGATFNTPIDGGDNVAAPLDGNLAANRVAGLGATISSIAIAPGQELWIRFFDSNSSLVDHGVGIDNFAISFVTAPVPEPSAFAALAGAAVLGLVALRRRRA